MHTDAICTIYSPFPKRWDSKLSSECKTKSKSASTYQLNSHELYESSTYYERNESFTWITESYTIYSPFPKRWDSNWSSECKTKSKSASRNYRSRSLWIRKCCIPMTVSSLVFSGTGCRFTAKWFTQSSHCVCQRVSACVFVFTSLCMSVCECVCICVYIIVFVSVWTDMSLLSLECLW